MLDQNTDRMWFVIGAVIVGAGIIALANLLFPKMFEDISTSFKGAIEGGLTEVGKIKPKVTP